jgi:hypothetical protein
MLRLNFSTFVLIHFSVSMIHCLIFYQIIAIHSPMIFCQSCGAQFWLGPKLLLALVLVGRSLLFTFETQLMDLG